MGNMIGDPSSEQSSKKFKAFVKHNDCMRKSNFKVLELLDLIPDQDKGGKLRES